MDQYRCPGSATEDFTDDIPRVWWDGGGTVLCNRCGKRVGLYPFGSTVARQMGAVDWRMKTHYVWGSTEGVNHEHCRFDKRDHSQ